MYTCMYCLCTCMYCLCTCMFCLCVCNAVHLCVFTFYGVFHIFCTSVYLLVLPVFFYLCYPVGFTCVFFNSVHLLVLSVFLYFCHICVSTIMVYFCTSVCFYLWWSWSWSSSFPGCPPVPWCWWWNTLVYRSVLCYDLLLSPETHQQVITASQKHNHQITPTDSVVCFGCFIFLSLLNFLFSYYQLFT